MRLFNNPILTSRIIGVGVCAWLSTVPAHAENAAAGADFHRGIAIAHAMAWAPIEPAPSRAFIFPPFADSANSLGIELRALRRTGFDFVRLAVDPGPFLQFPENINALARFKDDSAVLFSFHYYEPYQFTHQGASWMAARYLADVPYPALARSLRDSLEASAAAIAVTDLPLPQKSLAKLDAQERLESYRRSSFDRTTIAHSFEGITGWARDHGVPLNRVILGEFGAMKSDRPVNAARNAERARWFRDVREEAEAHGFIWAAWVYRGGGGFSLSKNETSTELEPAIVEALGFSR